MCSCILEITSLGQSASAARTKGIKPEGKNMINIYSCILNIGKCVALGHAKYGLERYYVDPVFAPPELSNGCSI